MNQTERKEIRNFFLSYFPEQRWVDTNGTFRAGNLIVYYFEEFNEWRLRKESLRDDICAFGPPFDKETWGALKEYIEEHLLIETEIV